METRRKIKIWSIATMDGYVSRLNGDVDFITDNPNLTNENYGFSAFYDSIAYAVMNRTQFINSDGLWSESEKPCYVVTDGGLNYNQSKNVRQILTNRGGLSSVILQIQALQNEAGDGDIWLIGNHKLILLLIEHKMVDEITVNILPLTLGSGIPLFSKNDKVNYWELLTHHQYDNGVIQMKYRVRES